MKTIKLLGAAALFFYFLCWFVDQPTKNIWYAGIALPWLSVIVCVPFMFIFENDDNNRVWKYCYSVTTVFYVLFVCFKTMDFLSQIPYVACCICLISYVEFKHIYKEYKTVYSNQCELKEKHELLAYQTRAVKAELSSIKKKTAEMALEQGKFDDETDQVILIARNKLMSKFIRELSDDLQTYEQMDNELYR